MELLVGTGFNATEAARIVTSVVTRSSLPANNALWLPRQMRKPVGFSGPTKNRLKTYRLRLSVSQAVSLVGQ